MLSQSISRHLTEVQIIDRLSEQGFQKPSGEQLAIIQAACDGQSIKVQAFAGTGKTTTIKMIAACIRTHGLYIAFNSAAVSDVRDRLPNTKAMTAHGLARQQVFARSDKQFQSKLDQHGKIWFKNTIFLHIGDLLSESEIAIVTRTLQRFIKTIDTDIVEEHISDLDKNKLKKISRSLADKITDCICVVAEKSRYTDQAQLLQKIKSCWADSTAKPDMKHISEAANKLFTNDKLTQLIANVIKNANRYSLKEPITVDDFPAADYQKIEQLEQSNNVPVYIECVKKITTAARKLWRKIIDPNCDMPINHDCYLKLWQLTKPEINEQLIYIDEAQDLDPVMLDVINCQQCQKIWVGDRYQQIYDWRGAVNALDKVGDIEEFSLTKSYRLPPSIADIANTILSKMGEMRRISSEGGAKPSTDSKHAFIARYNKTLTQKALELAEAGQHFYLKSFDETRLKKHCDSIICLARGIEPRMDLYKEFESLDMLEEHLEEADNDIMRKALAFCKLANFMGSAVETKLRLIAYHNDKSANLVLITAHQSKGLEWQQVELANDFSDAIEKQVSLKKQTTSEWNLYYVAVTRAKHTLNGTIPAFLFEN